MKTAASLAQAEVPATEGMQGLALGRIVGVNEDSVPLVDWPGNTAGPVPAAWLSTVEPGAQLPASPVLLGFAADAPGNPIIIGFVVTSAPAASDAKQGKTIESNEQITIKCGMSSIVLRPDGTIVLKGRKIVSRASELNRIKGASVLIN